MNRSWGGFRGGNKSGDPLPSIIGTATHTWLENALYMANERHTEETGDDTPIWIPESKVNVREGLSGTCDIYHVPSGSVLDWKCPGVDRFKKYTTKGPSPSYRTQVHLYGRGYVNLGLPVNYVGIIWIPRAGQLRNAKLWREPYNPEIVGNTLTRIDDTKQLMEGLDVKNHPENFKLIPISPDEDCYLCPWWCPPNEKITSPFQCKGKDE
jgi:hypothetical protein